MGLIKILPETLINKIAAGEVVERPASVVKELIENSIDAGADEIIIDILHGGKRLIRVSDNGIGMTKEDAILAFERHATSKIYEEGDLEKIGTMGFRGEALPSIASVSKVLMITSKKGASGTRIEIEGGKILRVSEAPPSSGTTVEVRDLFFNTPARLAFLKGLNTELSHIVGIVESEALGHPDISFTLNHNRKVFISLPGAKNFIERIHQIYGRDLVENLLEVRSDPLARDHSKITIVGYISKPPYSRADRSLQAIFINRRPVKNPVISHAIAEGYHSLMMKERYPVAFLFLEVDYKEVDVNVHPTKREVRFRNSSVVHDLIVRTIREAFSENSTEKRIERYDSEGVKEALEMYMRKVDLLKEEEGKQIGFGFTPKSEMTSKKAFLQAFKTYIVTVNGEGITIIDQHAAHERVLYEKLRSDKTDIQRLLTPESIELSPKEAIILQESLDLFKDTGIEIEGFGINTFLIRSIPAFLKGSDIKRLIFDILVELGKGRGVSRIDVIERIRTIMACHGAVRGNQSLTSEEMANLLEELKKTELPHNCPHGRPTTVHFGIADLEKLFRRR